MNMYFKKHATGNVFLTILCLFIFIKPDLSAQEVIPLWEGKAPGSENSQMKEEVLKMGGTTVIRNVVDPSLSVFLPDPENSNGTSVIVCPGGALRFLSWDSEGTWVAKWLNSYGITAFVLKYRVLKTPEENQGDASFKIPSKLDLRYANANPSPDNKEHSAIIQQSISDGEQALRLVRKNAGKWNIDPHRVGIMGFSAGGGVAIGTALSKDPEVCPDFLVSVYGPSMVDVHVPDNAPPLFIAVASGHKPVSAGCVALYTVWSEAGKPAEIHVYSKGNKPFGIQKQGFPSDHWTERFMEWLRAEGFYPPLP